MSALVQQGYRLTLAIFLVVLIGGGRAGLETSVLAITVSVLLFAVIGARQWIPGGRATVSSTSQTVNLNRLGLAFGLSMIPFAALDWADQAILTRAGGPGDAGRYAATKLVAVYPLLSLASIGGFLLMPEVVRRADRVTWERVKRWSLFMFAGSVAAMIAWLTVAIIVVPPLIQQNPQVNLLFVLCAVGGVRLFYLLPSSLLGALGGTELIVRTSFIGLFALLLLPLVAWVLGSQGVSAEVAVAIGLLAATCVRVAVSMVAVVGLTHKPGGSHDS